MSHVHAPFLEGHVASPSVPFDYDALILHPHPASPTQPHLLLPPPHASQQPPPSAPRPQPSPPHAHSASARASAAAAGRSRGRTRPRTGPPPAPSVREKPAHALRAPHLRRKRRGTGLEAVSPHAASSLVVFPPQPRAAPAPHTHRPRAPAAVEHGAAPCAALRRKRQKRTDPQGFLDKVHAQCQHIQHVARQLQLQYHLLKKEEEALYQLRRHLEALPLDDPYWSSLEFKHYSKTPLTPNENKGLDPHLVVEDTPITSPSLFSTLPPTSSLLDLETVGSMEDEEPVFDFNAFWDISPNDPFFFPPV